MAWEWLPKKLGCNFATSSIPVTTLFAEPYTAQTNIVRGSTPMSEDDAVLPFSKSWNLDDKLLITYEQDSNGLYTIGLTDISVTPNYGLVYVSGTNNQTPTNIDVMMAVEQDAVSAFPIFLMTQAGNTSNFIVISLLAALGGNRARLLGLLNAIPDESPVTYNWQSVPSISGKNGILSLVTLDSESINDGEPVSGAAVSVFDQAPSNDNNIKNLADTYGGGEESSAVDVTVKYKVTLPPGGSFNTLKIVAKKDSIPEDVSDGDKIVDISPSKTKKTVTGLDENALYYFKIFGEDTSNNTSESDEKHITTSGDEGWLFDYTGAIQTFTAPKTGIYSLETWGAQGGDATDGTNTARGGYGAYAYGEVLLQQGETIYINVGGQNGYGGGGNYVPPYIEIEPSILDNNVFVSSQSDAGYSPASYGANYYITLFPDTVSHFDNTKCILTGQQNKSAYTHTTDGQGNDIMSYSNNNTYSISVLAIPLGDLYDVSKIAFSYKIDSSGYEYKFINMWTANIDTSTGSVIESVSIFADNESKSWTDTEVNVNKQMNYLIVQTCNGQNALKDIKVYL